LVTPIVGSIDYYDEDDIDHHVGKITFFHVDLNSAVRTNLDPLNVLDHNPSTAPFIDMVQCIWDDDYDKSAHRFDYWSSNILVADRIEIDPEHRGERVTQKVFDEIIRLFGSDCSLLVLKAFPLKFEREYTEKQDWESYLPFQNLATDEVSALEKLMQHYEQIGFTRFKTDGVMYKPI
jgi:hypothetical protein